MIEERTRRETVLSIVIPSSNTKNVTLACIEAILEHPPECSFEIIVVDNGSLDGTASAVRERFPDVQVLEFSKPIGYAAAFNAGLARTTGEFVCLANSDTLVADGCLDTLIGTLQNNRNVGMVVPRVLGRDGKAQIICKRRPSLLREVGQSLGLSRLVPFLREDMSDFDHLKRRCVENVAGCFLLTKRRVLEDIGGMDDEFVLYAEDAELCWRLRANGWIILFEPRAVVTHLGGESTARDKEFFYLQQRLSRILFWYKVGGRLPCAIVTIASVVRELRLMVVSGVLSLVAAPQTCESGKLSSMFRIKVAAQVALKGVSLVTGWPTAAVVGSARGNRGSR